MGELIGLATLLFAGLVTAVALVVGVLARDLRYPPRHTAGYAVARGLATDPGELGLTFESWTHDAEAGVGLAVWEIASRGAPGEAPGATTVLVHDFGASRIDTLAAIEPWRGDAARLVLYDLRDHGESGGASRLGRGEERDLLSLLGSLGEGPFRVVGFGLGAGIAAAAAAAAPDAIDEVVAATPPRGPDEIVRARVEQAGVRLLAPVVRLAVRLI